MWLQLLMGMLPGILQFVETIHAPKPGQPKTGPTKLGAAINLAQNALTVAAAAGAIPNAAAQDISSIASQVEQTVQDMKKKGQLGGPSAAPEGVLNVQIPNNPVMTDDLVQHFSGTLPAPQGPPTFDMKKVPGWK